MSATAQGTEEKRAKARDQGRVLLIADEGASRSHVEALESSGFTVVGVVGGAAALVALGRERPHVVVADVRLNGIRADEFARILVRNEESAPCVFVGNEAADPERRLKAMEAGASDYFQTPSENDLLIARVSQLIRSGQLIDRLRAEADLDHLTGLANRRRFRKAIGQEVERRRRYGTPCALLLLDVDHMKRVNDAHGHPVGDTVIRAVARALSEHSRDNDTPARLGGEEFALLLAGIDGACAHAAAERLRLAVASERLEKVGSITISIGVAACPENARTERELFAASDAALYQAKRTGRDRTVVAPLLKSE